MASDTAVMFNIRKVMLACAVTLQGILAKKCNVLVPT
jgi:hypothetical protein